MNARSALVTLAAMAALAACAGGTPRSMTGPGARPAASRGPSRSVSGGEFRVIGRPDGTGDAYDAVMLFDRATEALRARRCEPALADYERLAREFPDSRYVAAAYYNRGVCLQVLRRFGDAVTSFRESITRSRERELVRDAWFRIAATAESMNPQRPDLVVEATTALLTLPGLTISEQIEARARQAAALLAQGDRARAVTIAQEAIDLAPTPEAIRALDDDAFIAEANFVQAEASRLDAADVVIDVSAPDLEAAIERRVGFVVHAHVRYNAAIRVGNADWAAASGFRLGEMYSDLYRAIVEARTPPEWDDHAVQIYRRRTAQRLRGMLSGALRAWEATVEMARRNGIQDNEWVRRTDEQIQALREMIANGGVAPSRSTPRATPNS